MHCLRCGKETAEYQEFCWDCQKDMARYPVDPNAVVQIPLRSRPAPKKVIRRKISAEEQVKILTRRVRICIMALIAALIVIICLAVPLYMHLTAQHNQIGQNYSIVKSPSADAGTYTETR